MPLSPITPDLREHVFAALEWTAELTGHVADDQRSLPTPCADFDVRSLLGHLGIVHEKLVGLARDLVDPYDAAAWNQETFEKVTRERVDGHTAAEIAAGFRAQAAAARTLWTAGRLHSPMTLSWGPARPGREVLSVYLMEAVAHGWDLATAIGQDAEAPAEAAEAALDAARRELPEDGPRGMEHWVPFDARVAPAPDAGPKIGRAHV